MTQRSRYGRRGLEDRIVLTIVVAFNGLLEQRCDRGEWNCENFGDHWSREKMQRGPRIVAGPRKPRLSDFATRECVWRPLFKKMRGVVEIF